MHQFLDSNKGFLLGKKSYIGPYLVCIAMTNWLAFLKIKKALLARRVETETMFYMSSYAFGSLIEGL